MPAHIPMTPQDGVPDKHSIYLDLVTLRKGNGVTEKKIQDCDSIVRAPSVVSLMASTKYFQSVFHAVKDALICFIYEQGWDDPSHRTILDYSLNIKQNHKEGDLTNRSQSCLTALYLSQATYRNEFRAAFEILATKLATTKICPCGDTQRGLFFMSREEYEHQIDLERARIIKSQISLLERELRTTVSNKAYDQDAQHFFVTYGQNAAFYFYSRVEEPSALWGDIFLWLLNRISQTVYPINIPANQDVISGDSVAQILQSFYRKGRPPNTRTITFPDSLRAIRPGGPLANIVRIGSTNATMNSLNRVRDPNILNTATKNTIQNLATIFAALEISGSWHLLDNPWKRKIRLMQPSLS